MAKIRPFRALRPAEGLEGQIASLPYDVYDEKEAREETLRSPLSFLKIDRPETMFPEGTDMYSPEVYEKARDTIRDMFRAGQFVQEETPCYYIYELEMNGRKQDGIVGCASIEDYMSGVIKKHEETRAKKEEDRIRHIDVCNMQTGPIFLAYRSRKELDAFVDGVKKRFALYDFTSEDGVNHRVWRIDEPQEIEAVGSLFGQIGSIYIADGHHRAASAVQVGLRRREAYCREEGIEDASGLPREFWEKAGLESDDFLAVLFPDSQLHILDYNRVVKDLNGCQAEDFLEQLRGFCDVTREKYPVRPVCKGSFGMYLGGAWYRLQLREEAVEMEETPVDSLDVSRLQRLVLEPLLGIHDPRQDERIDFVGGIRGLEELERRVDGGWAAAFSLYPTSMKELMDVADAGLLMPPKSTWFEPKLRSGLFLHEL